MPLQVKLKLTRNDPIRPTVCETNRKTMRLKTAARFAFFLALVCNVFGAISSNTILGQTLNEKLIAEDSNKLIEDAKQYGDIVRGAILFHQGNINCAKCHRPAAEKDRLGPDLSRIDPTASDAYVVESILQPSKELNKEYEPVVAITIEGKTVAGIILKQDDQQVVIRENQNADNTITIARKDLEEIRPGKVSSMPADLANELKDRKQFLDLLRYVLDVRARGPEQISNVDETRVRRSLEPELEGLILIQKHNCTACHKDDSLDLPIVAKHAPRLKWSGKHLNPDYLVNFIADPQATKPGTTMPHILGRFKGPEQKLFANELAAFILSEAKSEYQFQPIDISAAKRGFEIFSSVGCVACHAPRDSSGKEIAFQDSIPLGDVSSKYSVPALTEFLEDPLAVRTSGHMPDMNLTHREALDIANFLLQNSVPPEAGNGKVSFRSERGKEHFRQFNCSNCHTEFGPLPDEAKKGLPLNQLDSRKGCLNDGSAKEVTMSPKFSLNQTERLAIGAALQKLARKLTDNEKTEITLSAYNCIACHNRGDFGGVHPDRSHHFQTSNLNLGEQGRIPPTLTGVGAKLKRKWMRDVLVNSRSVRPYMSTRMPQYGEMNVGHLIDLFQKNDSLKPSTHATFKDQKTIREAGWKMAGHKGLNCVACHTYQFKTSDTMPAVDLTEMAERLKKDWFYQYMLDPQKFSPNTVMPSFWPGGNAIRKDLAGTPEDQIEALWQYLLDGRQARSPSGVVRERLEIVVTDEAQMLRRSYPEIGKRGIGVGYPGGVNIAYDAEQMRLGSIWKGKFADPGGVWTGQGHGRVRAIGQPMHFAKGPELDSANSPWTVDEGRPPKHQFKGYTLDAKQRPTFRYEFGSLNVEDFFLEVVDDTSKAASLRRIVKIMAGSEQSEKIKFRVASGKEVSLVSGALYAVDKLQIKVTSKTPPEMVEKNPGTRLEIPLNLKPNETATITLDYAWE